ncbi:MAG: VTT domain-containing protein [Chloroflexota bacterium]|nr:VTT domain-containing protein [Chloroflexota bacterium]
MENDGSPNDNPRGTQNDTTVIGYQKESPSEATHRPSQVYLRILTILIVIAITIAIFVFRDQVANLEAYGYLGAFLIALITSATVILPVPGILLIYALGAVYNPILIGLVSGTGSALGEITGYMAGFSGQLVLENNATYLRLEKWMKRRGVIVVFFLSLIPNPLFDIAGALSGVLKFPLWKFLVACFLGKTPRNILVAYAGAWSLSYVLEFLEKYF